MGSNDPSLTFAELTALFFNCVVPTLFSGSVTAAQETPPSATNNASVAVTFA